MQLQETDFPEEPFTPFNEGIVDLLNPLDGSSSDAPDGSGEIICKGQSTSLKSTLTVPTFLSRTVLRRVALFACDSLSGRVQPQPVDLPRSSCQCSVRGEKP